MMKMENGSYWGRKVETDDNGAALRKCHICAACKRVVTRSGVWEEVESSMLNDPSYTVSSVVCLNCLKNYFPKEYDTIFSVNSIN